MRDFACSVVVHVHVFCSLAESLLMTRAPMDACNARSASFIDFFAEVMQKYIFEHVSLLCNQEFAKFPLCPMYMSTVTWKYHDTQVV